MFCGGSQIGAYPSLSYILQRLRQFTAKAILVDCDGDAEWFPWDTVRFNDDGTVDIQEWIIKKKFPKG